MPPVQITSFRGDHAFLSNFYPCTVTFDGLTYPSAEHAYQASKSLDPNTREIIRNLLDAKTAKHYGRRVQIHSTFLQDRLQIMELILQSKFYDNIELAKRLLDTGDAHLCEGNTWNDYFWGVCRGRGQNHLGILLMSIRSRIRAAAERNRDARMAQVKFTRPLTPDDIIVDGPGRDVPFTDDNFAASPFPPEN